MVTLTVNGSAVSSLNAFPGTAIELQASGVGNGNLVEFLVWPSSQGNSPSDYAASVMAQGTGDSLGLASAVVTIPGPGSYLMAAYDTGQRQASNEVAVSSLLPVSVGTMAAIALGLGVAGFAASVVSLFWSRRR